MISLFTAGPVIMSIEEKMEADGRSIYVGNVRFFIHIVVNQSQVAFIYLCFNNFLCFKLMMETSLLQVDYGATAEELEAHFHGCGSVNRVTILCDKFTGHPKG